MEKSNLHLTGSCCCGAVSYEVRGALRDVIACHCRTCQKTSGHFNASTACASQNLHIIEDRGLTWFASSDFAERGFCRECGSSLFYRRKDRDAISIAAGSLDHPTGLTLAEHIYVAEKSDYYEIPEDLPHYDEGSGTISREV